MLTTVVAVLCVRIGTNRCAVIIIAVVIVDAGVQPANEANLLLVHAARVRHHCTENVFTERVFHAL